MNQETLQRHSRLGIASFIIALAVGVIVLVAVPVGILGMTAAQRSQHSTFPFAVGMGVAIILAYCGNLIGLVLGIAGSRQRDQKRGFAVAGLCLNACGTLLGTVVVVAGLSIRPAQRQQPPQIQATETMELPNKASEATSQPAPGAVSSSPQG